MIILPMISAADRTQMLPPGIFPAWDRCNVDRQCAKILSGAGKEKEPVIWL